jgi:hypothetical protein
MGFDCILTLSHNIFHNDDFIIRLCFTFNNGDRALRTSANTSTKAIAKKIADQSGFSINYLDGPFRTSRNTFFTPVT